MLIKLLFCLKRNINLFINFDFLIINFLFYLKLFCAPNYFGSNCETFCDETPNDYYACDIETGLKHCRDGFVGENCQIRKIFFYSFNIITQ